MKTSFKSILISILIIVTFSIIIIACSESNSTDSTEIPQQEMTTAQKLALVDNYTSKISSSTYNNLLSSLQSKFSESSLEISNITVGIQNKLKEKGVDISIYEMMVSVDSFFTSKGEPRPEYVEALAAYATLRAKGWTHEKATNGVRELYNSLGIY